MVLSLVRLSLLSHQMIRRLRCAPAQTQKFPDIRLKTGTFIFDCCSMTVRGGDEARPGWEARPMSGPLRVIDEHKNAVDADDIST